MDEDEMARGLDHLMEQNETELPFLASYGAEMDGLGIDVVALFSGVETFLTSRGVDFEVDEDYIKYNSSCISKHEEGLLIEIEHEHLPLVHSDLDRVGFFQGRLHEDKSKLSVILQMWGGEHRRFLERLVEHCV
ncbi:MAG: hypothetical protein QGG62_06865 [Candidatus Poseidoniaceae archaeon]|jgi:hypothetical protein|nr:hypothetical protein [Candidatus Poseidoniaceae archaeon]|tara:strand:+ start:250 stop:651 length:402 start_codon:yes stop_codon:yes gene_type:complete